MLRASPSAKPSGHYVISIVNDLSIHPSCQTDTRPNTRTPLSSNNPTPISRTPAPARSLRLCRRWLGSQRPPPAAGRIKE
jgi:hypothetical protein